MTCASRADVPEIAAVAQMELLAIHVLAEKSTQSDAVFWRHVGILSTLRRWMQ